MTHLADLSGHLSGEKKKIWTFHIVVKQDFLLNNLQKEFVTVYKALDVIFPGDFVD